MVWYDLHQEVRKMSNKRNIGIIFGVAAATVLASGGSIFLTNTGLTLIDKSVNTVQETESGLTAKETELPITVEQFAKTKDSFDILINGKVNTVRETETETKDQKETEKKETEKKETEKKETEKAKETEAASKTPETESTVSTEADTSILYASGNLNIRTGSGTDSEILGTFAQGDKVTVLGDAGDGWTKVSYQGQTGYVSSGYLSQKKPETSQGSSGGSSSGSSSSGQVMYATDYVYVRSDDDKNSSTLGCLSTGESVSVVGNTGTGWVQVNYNGQTGYVGENYLSWGQGGSSSGSSSSGSSSSGSGAWDDSFMMYDIDSRYISADELSGWSSSSLAILRNEIFARHGRIFTTPSWAEYFSQKTWYVPTYDPSYFDSNMKSFLNDCEWANLQVILAVEG